MAIFELLPSDLRARLEAIDPAQASEPGSTTASALLARAHDESTDHATVPVETPSSPRPRRAWALVVSIAAMIAVVVGLVIAFVPHSGHSGAPTSRSIGTSRLSAASPLTSCVDPDPVGYKPLPTSLAGHFVDDRVRSAFTLDGGDFQATPAPADAAPAISASAALCNLLAGVSPSNLPVADAAFAGGVSFGLATVTVADSVLHPGQHSDDIGGGQRDVTLEPYHARLAWIAVTAGGGGSFSCPAIRSPGAKPSPKVQSYDVVAIDANTGANGVVYSTTANYPCDQPGYIPPSVIPANEFVSLPWTLVERGPGEKSATITYQKRSCDLDTLDYSVATGEPVVTPEEAHPGLVAVEIERALTACGPPVATAVQLRGATLATDLPDHLTHAPVGAVDTHL